MLCDCDSVPASACERWLAGDPSSRCDPQTYGECARPIEGVPCCSRASYCDENGQIVETSICTDDCDQRCERVQRSSDCAAIGCEWFVPSGCFEDGGDDLVTTPRCDGGGAPCMPGDGTCPADQRCLGFPYDPCAGENCDACLGVDYRCAAP